MTPDELRYIVRYAIHENAPDPALASIITSAPDFNDLVSFLSVTYFDDSARIGEAAAWLVRTIDGADLRAKLAAGADRHVTAGHLCMGYVAAAR